MSAITGEICGYFIEQEEFTNGDVDFPEGSLGSVARSWLLQAMPGKTLPDVRNAYLRTPSEVHTALRGLAANI